MQDAIAGDELEKTYTYTIQLSVNQVKDFYDTEMPKLGWRLFAIGTAPTDTTWLFYMGTSGSASVWIFRSDLGVTYVMLTSS